MHCQTHLFKRKSHYYYRRKIPVDLQNKLGIKERKFSLKTKDPAEAAVLVREIATAEDKEFSELRATLFGTFRIVSKINREFIRDICERYEYAVLRADDDLRSERQNSDMLLAYIENRPSVMIDLRQALATGDTEKIHPALSVFLFLNQIELDCSSKDHDLLAYEFLKTLVRTHEKQLERDSGYIIDTPDIPIEKKDNPIEISASWRELIEVWIKNEIDRPPTTVDDVSHAVNQFKERLVNKRPSDVVKADVEAYRDFLFHDKKLEFNTVKKKVRFISTVFQVSLERELIAANPVSKVKIPKPRFLNNRLPYDNEDLKKIFSCPLYLEGERPKGGGGEASIWLPLLSLFTGCRLEEIAQLRIFDVKKEGDIWYIDIAKYTKDELRDLGTNVKNVPSLRKIPIHSMLIKLGFLDYHQQIIEQEHSRLFPYLHPDTKGKMSGNYSKWYGRYMRKATGIYDERKVFHSLRHTFRDLCRNAELSEEIADNFMGHTDNKKMGRRYGIGFSLQKLQLAIEKLTLPDDVLEIISRKK